MATNENLPPNVIKQLLRELKSLDEIPPEGIKVSVNEDDFSTIFADIEGPDGTPYENGLFRMKLILAHDFPRSPPEAIIPLYVVMILGYESARWWKMFTPAQYSGINRFVASFSIPLLAFQEISKNNPFKMSLKLIFSYALQKVLAGVLMLLGVKISGRGNFNWVITGLSLLSLPNTLIIGIPLLKAMYGDEAEVPVLHFVVLQSILWNNILLFLFEMSATAKTLETASLDTRGRQKDFYL